MISTDLHARLMRQIDVAYPVSRLSESNARLKREWRIDGPLFAEACELYYGHYLPRTDDAERALAAWLSDVGHDQDSDVYHHQQP